jgi:hypothetical protein
MLTVHQMPPKNQFLTGISSGYDKISYQNEPKRIIRLGFTGDCLCVDCCCENYQQKSVTATVTEFLFFSSTKPGVGLVLCARGFGSIKPDFEIETGKSNKFLLLFTIYQQA